MGGEGTRPIYGAGRRAPGVLRNVSGFAAFMTLFSFARCDYWDLVCTGRTQSCVVGHTILPWSDRVSFDRASTVEVRRRKGWTVVLHGPEGERTRLLKTTEEHAEEVAAAVRQVIAGERRQLHAKSRNDPIHGAYMGLLTFLGVALLLWAGWRHESRASEVPRPWARH